MTKDEADTLMRRMKELLENEYFIVITATRRRPTDVMPEVNSVIWASPAALNLMVDYVDEKIKPMI